MAFEGADESEKEAKFRSSVFMKRKEVQQRIAHFRMLRTTTNRQEFKVDVKKLMETYIQIAFVDPNELIQSRVGACRHCWSIGHKYHWKEHEYLDEIRDYEKKMAKWTGAGGKGPRPEMPDASGGLDYMATVEPNIECPVCEGEGVPRVVLQDTTQLSPGARLLYRGVQQTKDGVKILYANQDKALENIGRMIGAFDDKLRVDLTGAIANLRMISDDPKEAAEAYAKLIGS